MKGRGGAGGAVMMCALLLQVAAAHGDDGDDKDKTGWITGLVANVLIAVVAAAAGYGIIYPFEYVYKSSKYTSRAKNSRYFNPGAFLAALVETDFKAHYAMDFYAHRTQMLVPKLAVKLAIFGLMRGMGPVGLGKVIVAACVGGLVGLLYSLPFRHVEQEHADKFSELANRIRLQFDRDGLSSLYQGLLESVPYNLVFNILLFTVLEVVCKAGKENFFVNMFVAAPAAVVVASVAAAPLEEIRRLMLEDPFDLKAFLYDLGGPGWLDVEPDWAYLREFTKENSLKIVKLDYLSVLGKPRFNVHSITLGMALFLQHSILMAGGPKVPT